MEIDALQFIQLYDVNGWTMLSSFCFKYVDCKACNVVGVYLYNNKHHASADAFAVKSVFCDKP